MRFCSECGNELMDDAKFCPSCGKPVNQKDMTQRKQEFAGKIVKCPNCGAQLDSFKHKCDECGYELRGANTSSSVKEFELELKKIEKERKPSKGTGIGKAFAKAFGASTVNSVDSKLANLISNYSVPNTQEDIFEFMILAASNIDPMAHDKSNTGYSLAEREGRVMVSNAWDAKYNQVHQKALMMFSSDERLAGIEKLYKDKIKAIKKIKAKPFVIIVGGLGIYLLLMIFIMAMANGEGKREKQLESELNGIVEEIQEDITNKDYDNALIKANGLRFDENLDSNKAKQWDEQREYLIDMIEKAKQGE